MENNLDYGMTPQGFIPKRLAHIVDDLNRNISFITDDKGEFPFRNQTDDSILQQILGVVAEGLSECWEAAYDGSVQFDPLKNSGAGQAGTVQLNAMLLKPGAKTIVEMVLEGKEYAVISEGARIGSADGKQSYVTMEEAVIDASGQTIVRAECTEKGPYSPKAGTIVQIQTPESGWLNAKNTRTLVTGSNQETEEEARRRQQRSTSLTSYRQIDAIYAAVRNIPGVTYCRAYQNDRVYPFDQRGIPFKEVAVVAEGGDPRAIANALFMRFPVGVVGFGNTAETFHDDQGVSYAISFSRPKSVLINVRVDVTVTTRGDFPTYGEAEIKQAIVDYAKYGGEGNEEGFPPGADISCARLYTPVNRVPGHKITGIAISQVGEDVLTEDSIPIAWNQVGRFSLDRITVNMGWKEDID